MQYVDEFRQAAIAHKLADELSTLVDRPISVMEVCGGHTHAIYRHGLLDLLPANLTALHGPGCPVCVTPMSKIDRAIALARLPNVILASYGDMLRGPRLGVEPSRREGPGGRRAHRLFTSRRLDHRP